MNAADGNHVDLGSLASLDFTPDWVRKEAGVSVGAVERPMRSEPRNGDFPGKRERKQFSSGGRTFKKDEAAKPRFEERPKPLDAEVSVLPESKALGTIFRKLRQGYLAYKLKDLAYFFLDNPQSILVKVVPKTEVRFFQCKACSFVSTTKEDVVNHALSAHLGEYYDVKEVDREPPKGNFSCVAKCGLSGVLLGPPNMHDFNSIVAATIREKFPGMSEERYRSHIEMVRDPEVVEKWRLGVTKKSVYFAKGTADVEGAMALVREQAEAEFKRNFLPLLIVEPKVLMVTADVAAVSPCKPLAQAVRHAIENERRSPYNMCYALRGAFRHRAMNLFRVNDAKGQEFVSNIEYKPFDAEHAIDELKAASAFVDENPCCDKSEFPPEDADFEKHLNWLASTGHVVAFSNGVFSKVEKFPKYGPQWKKRRKRPEAAKAQEVKNDETADQLA